MMTLFRSRMLQRSVLGALVLSSIATGIASAQSACPQEVVGTTNYGNKLDGELIGSRSETTQKSTESGSTSGSISGSADGGVASGSATVGSTSGTTTTVSSTTVNIGTYQFEDGSRYEVNCSTLMVTQKLYPIASE